MNLLEVTPLTELKELAYRLSDTVTEADQALLTELHNQALSDLDNPDSLFVYTLAKAMRRRLTGVEATQHIYLQRFEIPQIRLFELLIQQFPLANLSQQCTNTLLIDALSRLNSPVLMDIGIGTGMQVVNILNGLAQQPNSVLRHLTIVGIEPFGEALDAAQATISKLAGSLPFTVTFTPRLTFIEHLSQNDLQQLLPHQHDGVYTNASFALHHIQQVAQRQSVFANLKALPVKALVLSEPNSDHYEPDYAQRFENCVGHYGALFKLIDQLPIVANEKAALKLFFGREIDDVLGNADDVRVEKHYATQQWVDLFEATGFRLQKRYAQFPMLELNGAHLQTDLSDRYATTNEGEEITSLFWAE